MRARGRLACAGGEGTVRLWEPTSGHPTATLEGHSGPVSGVTFSPGGRDSVSAATTRRCACGDAGSGPMISVLKLGAPATALAWGRCGIGVGAHVAVVDLRLVENAAA